MMSTVALVSCKADQSTVLCLAGPRFSIALHLELQGNVGMHVGLEDFPVGAVNKSPIRH
jgi:hypothetical protein